MTIYTIINTYEEDEGIHQVIGSFTTESAAKDWIDRNSTKEVAHLRQCHGYFEILERPLDEVPDIEVITEKEKKRRDDEHEKWENEMVSEWHAKIADYRAKEAAGEDVTGHEMYPFRKLFDGLELRTERSVTEIRTPLPGGGECKEVIIMNGPAY